MEGGSYFPLMCAFEPGPDARLCPFWVQCLARHLLACMREPFENDLTETLDCLQCGLHEGVSGRLNLPQGECRGESSTTRLDIWDDNSSDDIDGDDDVVGEDELDILAQLGFGAGDEAEVDPSQVDVDNYQKELDRELQWFMDAAANPLALLAPIQN